MFTRMMTVFGLTLLCVAPAGAVEIPREFYRLVNTMEFVADFARKCDTELTVYGVKAIGEHQCRLLIQEYQRLAEDPDVQRFFHEGQTLEQALRDSPDPPVRREWGQLDGRLVRALDDIERAVAHMRFLQRAEGEAAKPSKRRPTK